MIVDLDANGIKCVHAPKTMDLDLQSYSVGGDSTINRISDMIQHLKTTGKDQITIEHLLTMTSGFEWDEWGPSISDLNNDLVALWLCDDPLACILENPLVSEPGTDFTYNSGNTILLGAIIKNATGKDIEAFAAEYLFKPMGIDPVAWDWMNDEVIYAGGNQLMTPREMLKFGVTYLNHGLWDESREGTARPT